MHIAYTEMIYPHSRYCRSMNVSQEIAGKQGRKGLKVVFTSDKKKSGDGAQCTAQCIDPAPTTTPTPGIQIRWLSIQGTKILKFFLVTTTSTITNITGNLTCNSSIISRTLPIAAENASKSYKDNHKIHII